MYTLQLQQEFNEINMLCSLFVEETNEIYCVKKHNK